MQGYCALWLPGTDHSIATEARIVRPCKETEKGRHGREKVLERAWEWKRVYGGRIVEQLKKLGSSCDWERERFTMDEGLSKAVLEVFVRLYEKGLIYRGDRIINWCPKCCTSISDAEVEYEEQEGSFWHIEYPIKDSDGFVTVATTRPETMLGDTALPSIRMIAVQGIGREDSHSAADGQGIGHRRLYARGSGQASSR